MKINAPEKIYLPYKDGRLIGIVKTEGVKFNSGVDGHIEYVRKDVFIKKACFYIKDMVLDITYSDVDEKDNYNIDEFIEDFKNYMEGE